jgi:hypothetical protein
MKEGGRRKKADERRRRANSKESARPIFHPSSYILHPKRSGGGGIRTLVLHKIFHSVYARIPSIGVSERWPTGRRRSDESILISSVGGGHADKPAWICDTRMSPQAGLPLGHCYGKARLYAARAKLLFAVGIFPSVLPGTRGPGRAAMEPPTQSKPVAPLLLGE